MASGRWETVKVPDLPQHVKWLYRCCWIIPAKEKVHVLHFSLCLAKVDGVALEAGKKSLQFLLGLGTLWWKRSLMSSQEPPLILCWVACASLVFPVWWHKHVRMFLVQGTCCFLETGQNSFCGVRVAKGQAIIIGSPFSDDWGQVSILRLMW